MLLRNADQKKPERGMRRAVALVAATGTSLLLSVLLGSEHLFLSQMVTPQLYTKEERMGGKKKRREGGWGRKGGGMKGRWNNTMKDKTERQAQKDRENARPRTPRNMAVCRPTDSVKLELSPHSFGSLAFPCHLPPSHSTSPAHCSASTGKISSVLRRAYFPSSHRNEPKATISIAKKIGKSQKW